MLADWASALVALSDGVEAAFRERDHWFLLTAAGLTGDSAGEAAQAVEVIVRQLDLPAEHARALDLGCGTGRHLLALAALGASVAGCDGSARLVDVARRLVPDAEVVCADLHEGAESSGFDLVISMAHSTLLGASSEDHIAALRAARAAVRDHGVLVLELARGEECDAQRIWDGPGRLRITETVRASRSATALRNERTFVFELDDAEFIATLESTHYEVEELRRLTTEAGFRCESVLPLPVSAGSTGADSLVFLRAIPGFNYLSDLDVFLEAWRSPTHARNAADVTVSRAPSGRVTQPASGSLGHGASFTPHHSSFCGSLEPGIRPLVETLIKQWGLITYSSCEGHLVEQPGCEVFTEAYCGVITLSPRQEERVRVLLQAVLSSCGEDLSVTVRSRRLFGRTGSVQALDLLFGRTPITSSWAAYERAVGVAIPKAVDRLASLRARVPVPS